MKAESASVSGSTSFEDLYLGDFKKHNAHCNYSTDGTSFVIESPWGTKESRFIFDLVDVESIRELNNLLFRPQFDAIFHLDTNTIEFLFGYIPPDREPYRSIIDRKFEFYFEAEKYECGFGEPTERLMRLAQRYRHDPTRIGDLVVPQLLAFCDAQKLDAPAKVQDFFKGKTPRNFFVKLPRSVFDLEIEKVARHINFVTKYYDRNFPRIVIRPSSSSDTAIAKLEPKRFLENNFPDACSINRLDDFMLQLIEVASETSPRFAFVYYYQVLEYAGFYFLDSKARRDLRQLLKDPSMASCGEDKISQLFTFLVDLNHSDDVKMKRVIEEYCNPRIIWAEIENDREFFCAPIQFEGGFELQALISRDTTEATWGTMWMPKLYDHITKIRNCLVHARERRQSNVILPTKANTKSIGRYLPVIARVAEQITINKE